MTAVLGFLIALLSAHQVCADPPEKTLRLRVVDGATGSPLAGVDVKTRAASRTAKAWTDDQGVCPLDVPDPSPDSFTAWARKDGFVPVLVEWRGRGGERVPIPREHTLAMEKGTTIGGLVRDEAGNPVAGATVFVLVPSDEFREPGELRVSLWDHEEKTDAGGRWRCDVVPARLDDVWLRLAHPDFASDTMYGATPRPSMERLRDRSGVMVLKKGHHRLRPGPRRRRQAGRGRRGRPGGRPLGVALPGHDDRRGGQVPVRQLPGG